MMSNLGMHIAHSRGEKFLSVEQLAKLAGLKRRQIANLAKAGDVPGARRSSDGYHFEYPDTADLRLWSENKRRKTEERLQFSTPARRYGDLYSSHMELPRKVAHASHKARDGRANAERALQKAVKLACIAEIGKKYSEKHFPGMLRLIILREIEISGVHPDLLKRYSLPIGGSVAKSIAKWKAARLVVFYVEYICTEGGHFYELDNYGEAVLKRLGVDVRSIRKRIENQRPPCYAALPN